jgi:hypothetical protein
MRKASIILILCVAAVMAHAGDDKPVVYRIRTEEAITVPAGVTLTEDERKAVTRLNALMTRWPKLLWLGEHNGKLVLVKIGPDGQPMGAGK